MNTPIVVYLLGMAGLVVPDPGNPKSKVAMKRAALTCPLPAPQTDKRGLAWIVGAFAICPCHLPLTLGLIGTLLSGTAVGALMNRHLYIAGGAIALVWLAATWRGVSYLRSSRRTGEPNS